MRETKADETFCELINYLVTAGKCRDYGADYPEDAPHLERAAKRYCEGADDALQAWLRGVEALRSTE